jgi:hypothetical protein
MFGSYCAHLRKEQADSRIRAKQATSLPLATKEYIRGALIAVADFDISVGFFMILPGAGQQSHD